MVFAIMLIWPTFIWYFFQNNSSERELCSDGVYDYKVDLKYCYLLFAIPLFFICVRSHFGDSISYLHAFDVLNADDPGAFTSLALKEDSQLFYGLQIIFKKYVSKNSQIFISVIAFFQIGLILKTLKKYSCDLGMSIFLFIASAMCGQWMMNGIRQFIAVVVLFALSDCIIKNKWYIYIPVAILLMGLDPITSRFNLSEVPWYLGGIHQSALITIPVFFCIQGKPFNKKVWAVMIALILLVFSGGLDDILSASVENTTYNKDMENVATDSGTNFLRVAFAFIPIILAYFAKNDIMKEDTPEIIKISTNASFVSATLYLASAFTSGMYVGRLPIYTEIYSIILLPWLVTHSFKGLKSTVKTIVIILYSAFYVYQTIIKWSGLYYSNVINFGG